MSFRCGMCGEVQADGSSPTKVVLETRNKNYPERYKKTDQGNKVLDRGGSGYETVREVDACINCASASDEDREHQERRTRG